MSLNSTTGVISGSPTQTGTYLVNLLLTNAGGSSSSTLTLTVVSGTGGVAGTPVPRLTNLSSNAQVTSTLPLTDGFIIIGPSPKTVLLRAVGPGLTALKVPSVLDSTILTVYDSASKQILSVQGWGDTPTGSGTANLMKYFAQTGAFPLTVGSADSAVVTTLPPGAYTLKVSSGDGSTGTALAEVYDADPTPLTATGHLSNLSANGQVIVGTPLTGGFVIAGPSAKTVLLRAIGPSLSNFNISSPVPTPVLNVFDGNSKLVASNTGWSTQTTANPLYPPASVATIVADSATAGAFSLAAGSLDSVVEVTLPPGVYTAQVTDSGGNAGTALFEVYSVPP